MSRLRHIIVFLLLFAGMHGGAQTCLPNLDFENGNFDHWETSVGYASDNGSNFFFDISPGPPDPDHHFIMRDGVDSFGGFPRVCPFGGRYSARIGTRASGAEAEGLAYTFTIPATDTFVLTYFYALVMSNPNHEPFEQPRFEVSAVDLTAGGQVVDCSNVTYIANSTNPGFHLSPIGGTVYFHNWTGVGIRLTKLAGHQIRLQFRVGDCTKGGHFAYAYVDMATSCKGLTITAPICPGSPEVTLMAPAEYFMYQWYNHDFSTIVGYGQNLVLNPAPPAGTVFWVLLTPRVNMGCRDTVRAVVANLPLPDIPGGPSSYTYCLNQATFPIVAEPSPGHLLLWYDSPAGGPPLVSPPFPVTADTGTFTWWVSQIQAYGCEGPRRPVTVKVIDKLPITFTVNQDTQCLAGNSFLFTNTTTYLPGSRYNWNFGDNTRRNNAGFVPVSHNYAAAGSFVSSLELLDAGVCSGRRTRTLLVVPSPRAMLNAPEGFCLGQSALHLADNSTTTGGGITQWNWRVNGQEFHTRELYFPISTSAQVHVTLSVRSVEGCLSEVLDTLMDVHALPTARFSLAGHCDNAPVFGTDLSAPAAGDPREQIAQRAWYVDNVLADTAANPRLRMSAGAHTVWMSATSNFGCRDSSTPQAIAIDPGPHFSFSWSDSCAGRQLVFTAVDSVASVSSWRWHFGDAFRDGSNTEQRRFGQALVRTVQLAAATATGCVDTVRRVLRVYENRASAGRDTIAMTGEPLLLASSGDPAVRYLWSPADGLDDPASPRPIALWPVDQRYTLNTTDVRGCTGSASIMVRRIAGPDIYVPNAFTPNGDGRNDLLRAIPVGIRSFHYFALYDRWGREVFRTTDPSLGWDGRQGVQPTGTFTFVYMAEGIDVRGQRVFRKGTVTLVR